MNFLEALWSEAHAAHTLWLLALCLVALVSVRLRDPSHHRLRALGFWVGVHVIALVLDAALVSVEHHAHNEFRTVAWVFGGVAFVGAGMSLMLHGVLSRVRVQLPRIVEDVLVGVLALLAAVTAASRSGANLSGIIATSAVFTAVLGFSLQDVIGNVASGLALQVDTAIDVDDWIKVNDVIGRVVEVRWRYTAIETRNWETILVPNLVLLRNQVTILGRRGGKPRLWRRWVYFNVDWHHQPSDVLEVVQTAVRGVEIPRVAADPPPNCVLMDMADSYGHYALRYWLTDLAADDPTDSEVRTRIYFALQRAGIRLATPTQAVKVHQATVEAPSVKTEKQAVRRRDVLHKVGFFDMLDAEEFEALAMSLRYAPFARGEVVTRQGAEAHWLYLIEEGTVRICISEEGVEREVGRLGAGDAFGEMALLQGARREASVVAETDAECFRLERGTFQRVVDKHPEIVARFAEVVTKRKAQLTVAHEVLDAEAAKVRAQHDEKDLFQQIRGFLGMD